MKTLIVADHDNESLKPATLNAVAAAQQLGGDIDILVVGSGCQGVADAAASVAGVAGVLSVTGGVIRLTTLCRLVECPHLVLDHVPCCRDPPFSRLPRRLLPLEISFQD